MISQCKITLGIAILCGTVFAQEPAVSPALGYEDSFQLDYQDVRGTAYFTNAGVHANPPSPTTGSDICVNVYLYNSDATLFACCSCRVAPNSVVRIPFIPQNATGGDLAIVKLVATLPNRIPNACDARVVPNTARGVTGGLAAGMRAWSVSQPNGIQETLTTTTSKFSKVPLGEGELAKLAQQCGASSSVCPCVTGNQEPIAPFTHR